MRRQESIHIYERRINRVIDFVRRHLDEPLSLDRLARVAHFSPFHFHRLFQSLVGETVHGFVKRLRLERAVFHMTHGPTRSLTQVALECGFTSSSDFSRAFKEVFGFAPRQFTRERFREHRKNCEVDPVNPDYPVSMPWSYQTSLNPDRFRARLMDIPARRVALVRVIDSYNAPRLISGLERLLAWAVRHDLTGARLLGMSCDDPETTPRAKCQFDWCLELPTDFGSVRGVDETLLPAHRYAVVACRGDLAKEQRAWDWLFQSWLPTSGHQPSTDPAIESYRSRPEGTDWNRLDLDCCLPVKPLAR